MKTTNMIKTYRKLILLLAFLFVFNVGVVTVFGQENVSQGTFQAPDSSVTSRIPPDSSVTSGGPRNLPSNANTCPNNNCSLTNPFSFGSVNQLISKLLDIIIQVGGILAFFFIIYAGFLFVTAGGDTGQIEKAKATFLTVVIGTAIVLGAKAIQALVSGTIDQIIR